MWGSSHLNLECFIERFYSSAKFKLMFFDMFTKCKLAKSLVELKRKAWIYNCLYVFPLRSAVLIVFVISNVKHTTQTVRNTVLTFWEVTTLNLLWETLFDIAIDSSYFVMENSKKTWHWVDAAESSTSLLRGENTTLIGGSKLNWEKIKDTLKKTTKRNRYEHSWLWLHILRWPDLFS